MIKLITMLSQQKIEALIKRAPLLKKVLLKQPFLWVNPDQRKMDDLSDFSIGKDEMYQAAALWERFAPFIQKAFPETATAKGIIESPLRPIPHMQALLNQDIPIEGQLFLKCDNALPITGSIKARGGFYEVLHHAEELALQAGLLQPGEDYSVFASERFKTFFSQYHIGVASTGNLGLSIGMMSATLGFAVKVYMSQDAKAWKKELLREKGAQVIQFPGNFSDAIRKARHETQQDPKAYFVDDEDSYHLFMGYTIGAIRLAEQLKKQGISVDAQHPLFVYSPCGVGGSPGGTAFGLKQIFGDHLHSFFVEPTHSPAVLVGLLTGKMNEISVQDIGLDGLTEADGLAVARPSKFATKISKEIISGIYTIDDDRLYTLLAELLDTENLFLEPSATAGLIGPQMLAQTSYAQERGLDLKKATHIAWATGGDLVPEQQRKAFYARGKVLS